MAKLSIVPTILRETFLKEHLTREPEPDLIMAQKDQVEAFTQAGLQGALAAVYAYHSERASRTFRGAKTVLDLGCGSGTFLIKMARTNPSISFIGLDLSEAMLDIAQKAIDARGIKNIELKKGDFTDLSKFQSSSIDAVMSLQAIHHLPSFQNLEKMYSEIGRVLKPDGAIYLQDIIRLKSMKSILYFAHYDQSVPPLTRLDGEYSMRAAFLFKELNDLGKKYLPANLESFKTGVIGLYMVQKTPDRSLSSEAIQRIGAYVENLSSETRKIYNDLKFFHRLGGLR